MKMQPSFSLDLLRTYVAVVETASFTKAADVVLRSQPTISDQIKRLELLLDVVLLSRSARDIRVTPQGSVFLHYARRLLSLNDEMIDALCGTDLKQNLRISVQDTILSIRISQTLCRLQNSFPNLDISFSDAANADESPSCDAVISFATSRPAECEILAVDQLVWATSDRSLLQRDSPLAVIVPADHDPLSSITHAALDRSAIRWKIVHQSACGPLYALKAGAGVMAVPQTIITSDLHVVEPEYGLPELPAAYTLLRGETCQATTRLVDVVKRFFPVAG